MKKTCTSLIFSLLTALAGAEPVWLGQYSDSAGMSIKWEADSKQIEATPSWSGLGDCPFDIQKLTKLAFDYAQKQVDKPEKLKIDGISIYRAMRVGKNEALVDRWYLTVNFGWGSGDFPGSVRILTDGSIIEPTKKQKNGE